MKAVLAFLTMIVFSHAAAAAGIWRTGAMNRSIKTNRSGNALVLAILVLALAAFPASVSAEAFDYLNRQGNAVTTTHQAGYRIKIDPSFKPLGELHHRQSSGERHFKVSFAAYANGGDIILIHAERLEQDTGILTYQHLPRTSLNGIDFGFREQCVPEEAQADLETNAEALFVREKGFPLQLPFLLTQFLKAAPDGNAEVVISYGRAVASCSEISDAFRTETRHRTDAFVEVRKVE